MPRNRVLARARYRNRLGLLQGSPGWSRGLAEKSETPSTVRARCESPRGPASRPPAHRDDRARARPVVVNRQIKMVRAFVAMSANKKPRQTTRPLFDLRQALATVVALKGCARDLAALHPERRGALGPQFDAIH